MDIKNTLKKFAETLRLKFLWSIKTELIITFIVGAIFAYATTLIHKVDPTASPLDLGIIHFFLLAPLGVFVALLCVWLVINFGLTEMDKWFDGDYEKDDDLEKSGKSIWKDFFATTPATRLWVFVSIFSTIMISFALICTAVLQ